MRINGLGLFITASLVGLNLVLPTVITGGFVKLAIIGIVISQLSTLLMQIRGSISRAEMAGPSRFTRPSKTSPEIIKRAVMREVKLNPWLMI